ncbi:C40 family peptidase [Lutibacter maritimus]|uniref:SH3 domain-containing protein n=1 Tax=Lutibacter maritimus TaxID=593133 RepID=A0A1I6NVI6_9FLAO|nr:C40 family peptidase [Lutibacter maritimus]SFS31920.1 SH3 domain-containing protein [Lutibacter maritimus]
MSTLKNFIIGTFIILIGCNTATKNIDQYVQYNKNIQLKYAPDRRVALYTVAIEMKNDTLFLSGETNNAEAVNELITKLKHDKVVFKNNVDILPNATIATLKYAIVNNSIANIRSNPNHAAELATQAILGTELKVFKYDDYFYLVQTPDGYISWVDAGGITLMDATTFLAWQQAKKVIYTQIVGNVYEDEACTTIMSDIVIGAQLKLINQQKSRYQVQFPDGRIGYIKNNEASLYDDWIANVTPSKELIETYARSFLGSPYLWGGTSSKGMDCSGFVKTVYLMNGFVIPRDASQQIYAGKVVDENLTFEGLEKGDLLFFGAKADGDKKQRVTHVGIWLDNGKKEYIHASERVRINSADVNSPVYNEYLVTHYLGSKRYLGVNDTLITNLKLTTLATIEP